MKMLVILLSMLSMNIAVAQDFGVWGKVYPIEEQNLLSLITERLQSQTYPIQKLLTHIKQPHAIDDITKAHYANARVFDPSIKFKDQWINPLTKVSLKTPLLFIDGEDRTQVQWAENQIKHAPLSKVILVRGNPHLLSEQWQRPVYFDQNAQLTQRLTVNVVPTRITQQGFMFLIEEIKL